MIVADTCVWIEVLRASATGRRYRALLRRSDRLIVPTLVQFELRRWAFRELDEDAADRIIAATRAARVVPADEALALYAADLAHEHGLAMADAIIYATARDSMADLVTCDRHFEGLPGVRYAAKEVG
jgi:predicted nucleic acid-binding protein